MPRLASRIDKKTYYGMNILDYLVGNIEKILLNKKLRDYLKKWWSRSFLYVLFLQALEPVKIPFLRHELFIASDLGDAAVFDKGDTVGLADGGKPV